MTKRVSDIVGLFTADGWDVEPRVDGDGRLCLAHAGLHPVERDRVAVLATLAVHATELADRDAALRREIDRHHAKAMEQACQGTVRRWAHTCGQRVPHIMAACVYTCGGGLHVTLGETRGVSNLAWSDLFKALTDG